MILYQIYGGLFIVSQIIDMVTEKNTRWLVFSSGEFAVGCGSFYVFLSNILIPGKENIPTTRCSVRTIVAVVVAVN